MEPVQIGRGALRVSPPQPQGEGAAMEPVQIGRGDALVYSSVAADSAPQWSPSRSDGVTWSRPPSIVPAKPPQWSPSRSDGVTPRQLATRDGHARAAMEPVQIGRGDGQRLGADPSAEAAAMEPVQIGRGDRLPLRAEMSSGPPQWSPSRSDGVTRRASSTAALALRAAMEPVQIGRGDGSRASSARPGTWPQ